MLRKLSLRAHSRAELEKALADKQVPDDVAEQLLGRFTEVGLVDDAAFAAQWVQSRHRVGRLSRRALADELRRKGIDRDVIAEATQALDHDDEVAAAMDLAARKLRSMASITDPMVRRRRLAAALARRGYGSDVVHTVVTRVLADPADPLDTV
ncbi:regulatory protein RecX [Propionibacteriaceae bacterium G57]|uniref:regulatory protein RecX n=1 Tax=Aestuariimicrobium sp. G57 TaxID=3418485 RepID=UPI003DA73FD6